MHLRDNPPANQESVLDSISPYIRLAHDYVTEVDNRIELSHVVDHALHYFKSGEGRYVLNGNSYPIVPGTVFIVRPGIPFRFEANPGSHFHMLNLHFDLIPQADSSEIIWPYPQPGKTSRTPEPIRLPQETDSLNGFPEMALISEFAVYEQLFYRILQWFHQRDMIGLLRSKSAFLELLHIIWLHKQLKPAQHYDPSLEESLDAAVYYIASHLQDPLTIAILADLAHMSASYFAKCFKRRFNLSPIRYVSRMRIEHAKLELTLSHKPIKLIAAESGFDGLHAFYHAFRREAGLSPGEYRTIHAGLGALEID